jgi:hypothetical protein
MNAPSPIRPVWRIPTGLSPLVIVASWACCSFADSDLLSGLNGTSVVALAFGSFADRVGISACLNPSSACLKDLPLFSLLVEQG